MQIKTTLLRTASMVTLVYGSMLLSGCADDDETAALRIIHASPDAPAVNINLDNKTTISNLDYAQSSGFVDVDADKQDVVVEAIVPDGNLDVITIPDFNFEEDGRYTVLAVNNTADPIDYLAVNESSASPSASEVAISVTHAAVGVGNVGVYVTGPGDDISTMMPTFTFDYQGQVDAGALPAAEYRIRVDFPAGSKSVVYDSGEVDLTPFAGQKLLISAIKTVNSTAISASPVKLLVATDNAALTLLDSDTQAGARVVHLSPDAGAAASGPVEVFANSSPLPADYELIDAFAYTDKVPGADSYVPVPAAADYVFDVAPDNTGIGGSVYTSPVLALDAGTEYSVVAAGLVTNTDPTVTFRLIATADNNRSVLTQASVKVIHAAPAAGAVDVYVTNAGDFTAAQVENGDAGAPLLDGFAFGDITDYVAVAAGDYDIRVVPEATGTTAINVEGFNLAAASVSTVIARQPDDDGAPADFSVEVLTN